MKSIWQWNLNWGSKFEIQAWDGFWSFDTCIRSPNPLGIRFLENIWQVNSISSAILRSRLKIEFDLCKCSFPFGHAFECLFDNDFYLVPSMNSGFDVEPECTTWNCKFGTYNWVCRTHGLKLAIHSELIVDIVTKICRWGACWLYLYFQETRVGRGCA